MKTIIATIVLLVSTTSFAGELSWPQIYSDTSLGYIMPKYTLNGGNYFAAANEVCTTNNKVRTINKVEVCTEWEYHSGGDENYTCAQTAQKYMSAALSGVRKVCQSWNRNNSAEIDQWTCEYYAHEAYTLPTSFNIGVYNIGFSNDYHIDPDTMFPEFTKALNVPQCK